MIYDVIVIGGGPGGYLAAERAGHKGLSTLVIEKRSLGGVCLNEGCVPSKSLLYSAKIFDYAHHGEAYGVTTTGASIDQKVVIARKNKVVNQLVSGVKAVLKANKVTVVTGEAKICGKTSEGFEVTVLADKYIGKKLIIATGSMPVMPPIKGIENPNVMTNREILDLEVIPKNLVIVGGGVIGLEMASYYNSVGSKVTVIEMLPHIAGNTDKDIGKILMKNYEKKGVTFLLNSKVCELGADFVAYEKDGKLEKVKSDKILMSIGRRAVTSGFGLETLNVVLERGAIVTDKHLLTNIPNVYAVGDVNGKIMLAHTAYREAEVAVNHIVGHEDYMRYDAIPSVIYTNPEVGSVGETEESAKAKGIDYKLANITCKYSGRYVAENEGGDGIIKVLVSTRTNRLIGCHIIGNYSSEIIMTASMMIENEFSIDRIKEFVFPHPSVCEIIREAIFQL